MKKLYIFTSLLISIFTYGQLTVQVAHTFGGSANDAPSTIDVANDGSVYITGNFKGTVDFDPSNAVSNLTSDGSSNIFIQKLDSSGNLLWVKKINPKMAQSFLASKVTPDGSLLITGTFNNTIDIDPGVGVTSITSSADTDTFILKLDCNGNFIWGKNLITASTYFEYVSAIDCDITGNIYVAGYYLGICTIGETAVPNNGAYDGFILKMDFNGNASWTKRMGGQSYDAFTTLKVGADNAILLSGYYGETVDFNLGSDTYNLIAAGQQDGFLMKLDTNGNFLWAKSFGGDRFDNVPDFQLLSDGSIVVILNLTSTSITMNVAGSDVIFTNNINPTYVGDEYIILKTDSASNVLWAKQFGLPANDIAAHIEVDQSNKIYISGNFMNTVDFNPSSDINNLTSSGNTDIFIQCLTSDGNFHSAHKIGGSGEDSSYNFAYKDNSLYFIGTFVNTINLNPNDGETALNFTSNGGTDYFYSKYGVSNLSTFENNFDREVLLYPNPSNGIFNIQKENFKDNHVKIYDFSGRLIKQLALNSKVTTSRLAKGIYLLEVSAPEGKVAKKLIVQ